MRIVGVDLASQDERTGLVVLEVGPRDGTDGPCARVVAAQQGADDDEVLRATEGRDVDADPTAGDGPRAAAVGIDAPFGWPVSFTDVLAGWARGGSWTAGYDATDTVDLRMRVTDRVARDRTGRWPLSVSTDRIALPAMRAAHLLTRIARARHLPPLDRTGLHGVVEAWPVGSLRCWGLHVQGYNADSDLGRERRRALLDDHPGLAVPDDLLAVLVDHPDAFDALLAALTALAAHQGRTLRPTTQQIGPARLEGWIHLPSGTTLAEVLRRAGGGAEVDGAPAPGTQGGQVQLPVDEA